MSHGIQQQALVATNGTCISAECTDIWTVLQRSGDYLDDITDYCYKWERCKSHPPFSVISWQGA
jgi:hypothetical protein